MERRCPLLESKFRIFPVNQPRTRKEKEKRTYINNYYRDTKKRGVAGGFFEHFFNSRCRLTRSKPYVKYCYWETNDIFVIRKK